MLICLDELVNLDIYVGAKTRGCVVCKGVYEVSKILFSQNV